MTTDTPTGAQQTGQGMTDPEQEIRWNRQAASDVPALCAEVETLRAQLAAVPDLLAALREVEHDQLYSEIAQFRGDIRAATIVNLVRTAIAKAEGRG